MGNLSLLGLNGGFIRLFFSSWVYFSLSEWMSSGYFYNTSFGFITGKLSKNWIIVIGMWPKLLNKEMFGKKFADDFLD